MACQTSVIHRTTKAQILPFYALVCSYYLSVHTNLVPRVLSYPSQRNSPLPCRNGYERTLRTRLRAYLVISWVYILCKASWRFTSVMIFLRLTGKLKQQDHVSCS